MSSITACGNCVYFGLMELFPPTRSWVFIFPIWFILLAGVRTFTRTHLSWIPSVFLAIPLVLAVAALAPAMIGPPLGFWIPFCCLLGTSSGRQSFQKRSINRVVTGLALAASFSLILFGGYDYYVTLPR